MLMSNKRKSSSDFTNTHLMKRIFVSNSLIITVGLLSLFTTGCEAGPDEDRLLKFLLEDSGYNKISRPVANDSDPVVVQFKMEMQQIIDVDETDENLKSTQWLHFEWKEERLKWDPSEYGGITALSIPIENLWKPDILVYNSVDEDIDNRYETNAYVANTGDLIWIPIGVFLTACSINIEWFPFDTQTCYMKFGSWTYGFEYLNLTLMSEEIDISNYQQNGEWDLLEAVAQRNELWYECCPLPFVDITFTIKVRRRPGFYLLNVLIPCTFVSVLTLFNFLQAPDSGEKVGLGITIMLSLSVFQLIIADMIPRTSTSVPIIGAYFCGVMCLCTVSLTMTLLTLKCHHTKPDMHKMPEWMRIAICEWLSWFLRMQRPGKRVTKKYLKQQWSSRRSKSRVRSFVASPEILQEAKTSATFGAQTTSTGSVSLALNLKEEARDLSENGFQTSDCSNVVPFYAMAAQDLETLRYELRTILNEVKCVTKKIQDDEAAGSEVNEWQYAALVVDRLCFWLSSFLFTLGTVCVFVIAPQHH